MTKKLFILLLVIFFASCKKIGNSHVKGTVREIVTGNPIQGQKLILGRWKTYRANGNLIYEHVDSTTTNASGEYSIKFYKKRGYRYDIICPNQDHFPTRESRGISSELFEKEATKDFDLEPVSFLQVHLHKTQFSIHPIKLFLNEIEHSGFYGYDPCNMLLPRVYTMHGVLSNHIHWSVIDQDGFMLKDSIFDVKINRGDTFLLYMTVD